MNHLFKLFSKLENPPTSLVSYILTIQRNFLPINIQVVGALWVVMGTIVEQLEVDPAFLFSVPQPAHSDVTVEGIP